MAVSSYYYHPVSKRKTRALDADLVVAIDKARRGYCEVYGYRKVTKALQAQGSRSMAKRCCDTCALWE